MVENVIFDMGGVLLSWTPLKFARKYTDSDEDAKLVADALYGSSIWGMQDAGAISSETMLWTAQHNLPERLRDACASAFNNFPKDHEVFSDVAEYAAELRSRGYKTFLLSNAGIRVRAEELPRIPGIEDFSGIVISYEEHLVKPDVEIYKLLCNRYKIAPETCVFIDDTEINCVAAERAGMKSYHHTAGVAEMRAAIEPMLEPHN